MYIKLPFGLRDGKLVSIESVVRGVKCNCVCPTCKQPLIARQGDIKEHHFAHYGNDCNRGCETAIHIISKDIFNTSTTFITPPFYFPYSNVPIIDHSIIRIDEVTLESKVGSIVPDIVIKTQGKVLLVEITVTHGVDWEKLSKIKKLNLPAIEIFAGHLFQKLFANNISMIESNEFKHHLLEDLGSKRWINNSKGDKLIAQIKSKLKDSYCKQKEIKSLEFYDFYMRYIDNCPLNKRTWKRGKSKGRSYADFNSDCYCCPYNVESGDKLFCFGHHQKQANNIIKGLSKT